MNSSCTAPPTIVMGVSGYKLNSSCTSSGRMIQACIGLLVDHVELLIHFFVTTGESQIQAVLRDQVPVVRRFSGGGTVIVDQGTIFVTFICNKSDAAELQPFPWDIMSWSGQLYGKVFDRFGEFHLRENGMKKIAQSFIVC